MIVTSIIAAPTKKIAAFYDPKTEEIVYKTCEVIGLVQLQNPDEEDIQQVPCYMFCNPDGYFFVPELEYDFLQYVDKTHELDIDSFKPLMEEIKKAYQETQVEVVEVKTTGKISTIKRTIKRLDNDETTDKS